MTKYKQRTRILSDEDFQSFAEMLKSGKFASNGNPVSLGKIIECNFAPVKEYIQKDKDIEAIYKSRKYRALRLIRSVGIEDKNGELIPAFNFNKSKGYESVRTNDYQKKILVRFIKNAIAHCKQFPKVEKKLKEAIILSL